ncbi:MAG: alpha/beta hydrolase [Acidimicrobiia bacterium]
MTQSLLLHTADGLSLEAEETVPAPTPVGTVVLCHPHPQHGGTMQSIIISTLFGALPDAGFTALRFNYRGVGTSEGTYADGLGEQLDLQAAVDAAQLRFDNGAPLAIVGWSFGADVALAQADARAGAVVAIAPPLRDLSRFEARTHDPRPKLVVLAGSDEVIDNAVAERVAPTWPNTTVEVVPGASHYFIGRTQRVVDLVLAFLQTHASALM